MLNVQLNIADKTAMAGFESKVVPGSIGNVPFELSEGVGGLMVSIANTSYYVKAEDLVVAAFRHHNGDLSHG